MKPCSWSIQVNNFLEYSSTWETKIQSNDQEIILILRNPNIYYCVHRNPPLVRILSQKHVVPNFDRICFRSIIIILPSVAR